LLTTFTLTRWRLALVAVGGRGKRQATTAEVADEPAVTL